MAHSPHIRSLKTARPVFDSDRGTIQKIDASELPLLSRISARRLVLAPLAVREPHWKVNAHELGYCLRGEALVTIFETGSQFHSFTITAGQMYFVPSGSLFHIENTGTDELEVISTLSHEKPEEFGISGSFGAFSDAVIGNAYDLPAGDFLARSHNTTNTVIGTRDQPAQINDDARRLDAYKFDVEAMSAPVATVSGLARTARKQFWPVLEDLSMYSLVIPDDGMREPHWHPITAEMGYVAKGDARMTILDPDGTADTYLLHEGDVYFVPKAYPHHIENIGPDDFHFLIFFDQVMPQDIGFRASISGFTREVLGAAFGENADRVPNFPFTAADPLVVHRTNPVDATV